MRCMHTNALFHRNDVRVVSGKSYHIKIIIMHAFHRLVYFSPSKLKVLFLYVCLIFSLHLNIKHVLKTCCDDSHCLLFSLELSIACQQLNWTILSVKKCIVIKHNKYGKQMFCLINWILFVNIKTIQQNAGLRESHFEKK